MPNKTTKPKYHAFLTRWEAAVHIQKRLDAIGLDAGLDIYQLLTENGRNPDSMEAIARGYDRGNRRKYGHIETLRKGSRTYYSRTHLDEWLDLVFIPALILADINKAA